MPVWQLLGLMDAMPKIKAEDLNYQVFIANFFAKHPASKKQIKPFERARRAFIKLLSKMAGEEAKPEMKKKKQFNYVNPAEMDETQLELLRQWQKERGISNGK